MAEWARRPAVRVHRFTVTSDGRKRKVAAPSVDDIVRGILWDLKNSRGLSIQALADLIGLPKNTVHQFMDRDHDGGTRLVTLTHLAGALGLSPVDALRKHPALEDDAISSTLIQRVQNEPEPISELLALSDATGLGNVAIQSVLGLLRAIAERDGLDMNEIQAAAERMRDSSSG